MKICLFPGQGSQSKGMGAELFDRYPDWTAEADAVLGFSIRELCVDDPRGELGLTQFTQPALYVVNALTYRARQDDGGAVPDFVAGHSLGEYNALLAAGVFDFATGLRMVKRRGEIMGQVSGGGMAAPRLAGTTLIYVPGVLWLGVLYGFDAPILAWGLTPFLVADALKLGLAALVVPGLWKLVGRARG